MSDYILSDEAKSALTKSHHRNITASVNALDSLGNLVAVLLQQTSPHDLIPIAERISTTIKQTKEVLEPLRDYQIEGLQL